MERPWWLKKNEPATDYDDDFDVSGTYYGEEKKTDEGDGTAYGDYDNTDVSEVGVAWSEEEAKAIAKANEPLKKRSFSPKTCQDSPVIVDAFKDGRAIVICVEELDRENFLRLFDYVMGAVHALDGELIRVDRDTVVLLPYGVDAETNVDELEEAEDEESEETAEMDNEDDAE